MRGIYEAWKLPGSDEEEGSISSTEAKPIGATIIIAGLYRKFRIWWDERSLCYDRGCWRLEERNVVGARHPAEEWIALDEFRSLRQAKAEATRLAKGATR